MEDINDERDFHEERYNAALLRYESELDDPTDLFGAALAYGLNRIDQLTDEELATACDAARYYHVKDGAGLDVHTPFADQAVDLFRSYSRSDIAVRELVENPVTSPVGSRWVSGSITLEVC